MATAKFVCGAECGIAVVGTASNGTEHWSGVDATPTVVTSGPASMRSTRAFLFNATGATCRLTHTFATTIASPATMVARFYVYFAALPSGDTLLFGSVGANTGPAFRQSDSKIYAHSGAAFGTGFGATGVSVTTGQWYRIDVQIVRNTTETVDVQVDGTACGQAGRSTTAQAIANCFIGSSQAVDCDHYIDDLIVAVDSYPIGAGTTVGLYPNGDRTNTEANPAAGNFGHFYSATNDFGKGASGGDDLGAQNVEATSWQSLANPLSISTATNWVQNKTATGGGAEHLVWTHDALPAGAATVNGVMLVAATHSVTSTGNNQSMKLSDASGNTVDAWSLLDLSEDTITVPCAVLATAPDGSAWTVAKLNASFFRWGDSSDANPDSILDSVCLEADAAAAAGGVAITGAGSSAATGRGAVILTAGIAGKGTAANAARASASLTLAITGKATNANLGRGALQIVAGLSGAGAAAATGKAALDVSAAPTVVAITGHADNANTARAGLAVGANLTGAAANAATGSTTTLNVAAGLAGRAANANIATGSLTLAEGLSGQGAQASSASARVDLAATLAGTSPNANTAFASLTVTPAAANPVDLTGTAANAADLDATATAIRGLTGHADAANTSLGSLTVTPAAGAQVALTGSSSNANTATGTLALTAGLSGHGDAANGARNALTLTVGLAGHGDNANSGLAGLTVTAGGQVALAGSAANTNAATGALSATLSLAGHSEATNAARGALSLTAGLSGRAGNTNAATGAFKLTAGLSGAGPNANTATAALTVAIAGEVTLTGKTGNANAGTGRLTLTATLAGTSANTNTGRGALNLAVKLAGTAPNANAATGALATPITPVTPEPEPAPGGAFVPSLPRRVREPRRHRRRLTLTVRWHTIVIAPRPIPAGPHRMRGQTTARGMTYRNELRRTCHRHAERRTRYTPTLETRGQHTTPHTYRDELLAVAALLLDP